jgi:nitrogen fixation protein FixH
MTTAHVMNTTQSESGFRLKGWHVLAIIVAFFVVVFAVNIGMAVLAVKTFSGVQTEKPYENGLAFNKEIANAEAQNARHWSVTENLIRDADGVVTLKSMFKDDKGLAIGGLDITTTLKAPMDAKRDHVIMLNDRGGGLYDGKVEAPAGQWDVETIAKKNDDVVYRSVNRVILK